VSFDLRALVYGSLKNDSVLTGFWADRFYQRSSMENEVPPSQRPFGIYYLDRENLVLTPSALKARSLTVQVWVHDEPGDYYQIDQVLDRVREVLEATPAQDKFLEFRLLFKSSDLYDDLLKTIVRYSRFDAILAP
jgi:hypothetical protein